MSVEAVVGCCAHADVVFGIECSLLLTLSIRLHHPVFAICIKGVYCVGMSTVSPVGPSSRLFTCHPSQSDLGKLGVGAELGVWLICEQRATDQNFPGSPTNHASPLP